MTEDKLNHYNMILEKRNNLLEADLADTKRRLEIATKELEKIAMLWNTTDPVGLSTLIAREALAQIEGEK